MASAASKLVPALLRVVASSKQRVLTVTASLVVVLQRVLTASLSRRGDRLAGVLLLTGGGGESYYYHSPPRLALSTTAYSCTLAQIARQTDTSSISKFSCVDIKWVLWVTKLCA